ncbi:MAG: cell division FtsK/SpoIIIE [candidate division TM6 bacterium GW2011_GWF2_43_87]|nr:MAG: cell division FtsK/SpoIIIE [candidate division TM6 bacterium GW2011_GWF2_43_87]
MVHRSILSKTQVCGLFFIGVSLFLAVILATFNPHDPSPFFQIASLDPVPMHNRGGAVGAYVAAWLIFLCGSAVFWLIPFFLWLGWDVFCWSHPKGTHHSPDWSRIFGFLVLLVAQSLFFFQQGYDPVRLGSAGGKVGAVATRLLLSWSDTLVAYATAMVLALIGFILVARFAWASHLCHAVCFCGRQVGAGHLLRWLKELAYCYVLPPFRAMHRAWNEMKNAVVGVFTLKDLERIAGEKRVENSVFPNNSSETADGVFDDQFWEELQGRLKTIPMALFEGAQVDAGELDGGNGGDGGDGGDGGGDSCVQSLPEGEATSVLPGAEPEVFALPSDSLLAYPPKEGGADERARDAQERARQLEDKLRFFGINGRVLATIVGPVVTLFEYAPAEDVKLSRILALEDDLSLALKALSLRIIAPIPGRSVVGFEVANRVREAVNFSTLVTSKAFRDSLAALPLVLGRDTQGGDVVVDLAQMPHLLVAGSTGSGKSVALHAMLMSLFYKRTPQEVRLVLIDPKRLEFAMYADIPHLLVPVETNVPRVPALLHWLTQVMEDRYSQMAQAGVRSIQEFRQREGAGAMPYLVVMMDELADIMMVAGKEVEPALARLAQMARAAGIHLIVATQRPSVDVLTGLIKVNFPARIAFKVASKIDARTILDALGAERLLGKGDLLFLNPRGALERMHGALVRDEEIAAVAAHLRAQQKVEYETIAENRATENQGGSDDPLIAEVVLFVQSVDEISISLLQRRFRVGYNRAACLVEALEARGVISPATGAKMRKVQRDASPS